uniref:Thyroglobulin type-1 domain-containing protein n=1 Tax=Fundulus heteroclitus TaxID=8078 RepID=A0A3Q2PKH0_FUNHE
MNTVSVLLTTSTYAPKTRCEEQRDRAQANIQEQYPSAGVFVPRCDAEGQYLPRQCHGSTGHCWCVDSSGQERAGTRTPPGATPVDCKKPGKRAVFQQRMDYRCVEI